MPLPTGDTIGLLADNLRLRNSVLPISARSATRWARGLNLPRGGETVLYTGLTYQLVPYIAAMSKSQEKIEDSWLAQFVSVGRLVNKVVNVSAFMALPSKTMQEEFDRVLVNIARLLKQAGVDFGCLYEDDLYSGALAYDLGADQVVQDHAVKIYQIFKKYGVKNVITLDPHTTHMLRGVFPSMLKGYEVNVKSYLEVLVEKNIAPLKGLGVEAVLHDSCVYARYENVLSEQRTLLAGAGVTVREPKDAGKYTLCCGGPAESLFPKRAAAGAKMRAQQLRQAGDKAITMCPICYVNLMKAAGEDKTDLKLEDISGYLVQAYCKKE